MRPASGAPTPVAAPPAVSLCIPTFQSEPFIRDTLAQALAQTWPELRVLVSVDACDDGTAEACLETAKDDPRLDVVVQTERLGWAANVNALLDRVDTPYFCLYFHDDRLAPDYAARLLSVLQADPDAVSVHCDMGHYGASEHVSLGVDYPDELAQRLAWFFVAPNRGSPLRSLTRTRLLEDGLRLPTAAPDGLWANEPYLLGLLAAGRMRHVPETLYWRWDKRKGGLIDGWKQLSFAQQIAGYGTNTDAFLATIDAAGLAADQRAALHLCVRANVLARVRQVERDYGRAAPLPAAEIHPAFAEPIDLRVLASLGPQLQAWVERRAALGRPV